ncbi:GNAT family N-acetyltransferase [Halopseudomonas bauzanensis]|uniref:GNAT family N-acetyltransferase n=1 Tax=Halopseudomonas bauzanensis TaxID=653930 RepID=UPI0035242EAF
MKKKAHKFFETFFLKERCLFKVATKTDMLSEDDVSRISICDNSSDLPEEVHGSLSLDDVLEKHVRARRYKESWISFFYITEGHLKGYAFLHIPKESEWNDALETKMDEARISSVYVYENCRGNRIAEKLVSAMARHAKTLERKPWSVVEKTNTASMKLFSRVGDVYRNNYLFKIWGRNIISAVGNPIEVNVLLGSKRARR